MDTHPELTPLLRNGKEEYLGLVTKALAPHILTTFKDLYVDALKTHKPNQVMRAFQHALRKIPSWNAHTVRSMTEHIELHHKSLHKLIAALFVSIIKIMSSIRLHKDRQPNIRLKLPTNDVFVHQVYIQAAQEFYGNPHLINEHRNVRIATVRAGVEAAVGEMLPIDDILNAYLGGTVDGDNTMSPDEEWPAAEPVAAEAPPPPAPPVEHAAAPASPAEDADDTGGGGDAGGDEDEDEPDTREIDLHRNGGGDGGDGAGSVVVPSTQPDPESAEAKHRKDKELFSDAEEEF